MWSRKDLKTRAKAVLRTNYWKAFLISLVIGVVSGGGGGGGSSGSSDSYNNSSGSNFSDFANENTFLVMAIGIAVFLAVFFVILLVVAAFRIFLGYPLEVGGRRYFIKSAEYSDNKKCFSIAFRAENYKGIVLTMLLKGVQNFLWYLLFIIPGIVKSYAYKMVPYILADNPNIGYKRAIELSNKMTNGHKFSMFVLHLSFIGWYLLGLLALVIGILFVMPYQFATEAELYLELRKNALENGLTSYGELLLSNGAGNTQEG